MTNQSRRYEICINAHLSDAWLLNFEEMTISRMDDGRSILTGMIADQAALHAILRKIRDMGLELISVNQLDEDENKGEKNARNNESNGL